MLAEWTLWVADILVLNSIYESGEALPVEYMILMTAKLQDVCICFPVYKANRAVQTIRWVARVL